MPFYSTFKEISPSSRCKEDEKGHYILIHVPDFRKDNIKIQVDTFGALTVIGGRVAADGTYIKFEETFQLPDNSDIHNVTGMLEGEILHVNVPKLVTGAKRESPIDQKESSSETSEEEKEEDSDYSDATSDSQEEKAMHQQENREERSSNHPCGDKGKNDKAGRECSLSEIVIKKWNAHKGLVITAVLAFTVGILISPKLQQIPAN